MSWRAVRPPVGPHDGDSAAMAVIELVDRDEDARGQDSGPVEVEADDYESAMPAAI